LDVRAVGRFIAETKVDGIATSVVEIVEMVALADECQVVAERVGRRMEETTQRLGLRE
jgi:hypothetical protein